MSRWNDADCWVGRELAEGPRPAADFAAAAQAKGIGRRELRKAIAAVGGERDATGKRWRLPDLQRSYWTAFCREYDRLIAEAEARGRKQAHERCVRILLRNPHAEGRNRLAWHLIEQDEVTIEEAIAHLRISPLDGSMLEG